MMNVHEEYDNLESVDDTVAREKKLAKAEEKDYNLFMLNVELAMRDKPARHFIREILKWCGFYSLVTPNEETAVHAEGRRCVGVQIKEALDQINPKLYHELMIEGVDYEKALLEP